MNAMEKVAWIELVVSVVAVAVATMLFPWFGSRATSAFALLALAAVGLVFLRRSGQRVVVDERDTQISRRAGSIGVGTAWMTLVVVLIAATTWSSYSDVHTVSTALLNWLIWIQFAILYGTNGLVAVVLYRRQKHAA